MLKQYGQAMSQGDPMAKYEGERVADLSPLQRQSLTQAGGFMDAFSADRGIPLYEETGDALAGILRGEGGAEQLSLDQANQRFNEAYVDPAQYMFSKYTAPTIREEFAGPGYWGTARANAVGSAGADLQSQLEARRSQYLWDTETTNRQLQEAQAGRTQAGVSQGMAYGQGEIQNMLQRMQGNQGLFAFGTAEQQHQQNIINADIEKFMQEQRKMNPEDLTVMLALLGMNYSTSSMDSEGSGSSMSRAWNASGSFMGG
jgi:hypothetical protein